LTAERLKSRLRRLLEPIYSLLAKSSASGSRSTALAPMHWLVALLLSAMIAAIEFKADASMVRVLAGASLIAIGIDCFAYLYLLFNDRDALRSEHFSIEKMRGIKADLLRFLEQRVEVSADEGACVITLPTKTVDGRYVEVYVEPTVTDIVMVHDGGNAVTELFLQGLHLTEARAAQLKSIAKSHGVSFADNAFSTVAKPESLSDAVLAISQCTSLAMVDVLKHVPFLEEERGQEGPPRDPGSSSSSSTDRPSPPQEPQTP
jgi:hypothetical protein